MKHAINELKMVLETAKNNEPIDRKEGNIEQADYNAERIEDLTFTIFLLEGLLQREPDIFEQYLPQNYFKRNKGIVEIPPGEQHHAGMAQTTVEENQENAWLERYDWLEFNGRSRASSWSSGDEVEFQEWKRAKEKKTAASALEAFSEAREKLKQQAGVVPPKYPDYFDFFIGEALGSGLSEEEFASAMVPPERKILIIEKLPNGKRRVHLGDADFAQPYNLGQITVCEIDAYRRGISIEEYAKEVIPNGCRLVKITKQDDWMHTVYYDHTVIDDDLGELDPSAACKLEDGTCEACQ